MSSKSEKMLEEKSGADAAELLTPAKP